MSTQMVPIDSPERLSVSADSPSAPARYVCFGPFRLDLKKDEFFKDGMRVKLQGKVHQALLALLERPGEIVTREQLRLHLWPSDTHVNYDANVNTTVNKLRQVLGDSTEQPVFVETVPRKGYSFVARIEYADQPPAAPKAREPQGEAASAACSASGPTFFQKVLVSHWFAAGVVTLVISSMLFGAALVLYAHR